MLAACGKAKTAEPAATPAAISDAGANAPAVQAETPTDYSQPVSWLCRPETEDACDGDASATIVMADGKLTKEKFAAAKDAPIDCFYVYPTISIDPTPNSDIVPGDEEKRTALVQAARFGSVCRIYAPMYRQTTLTALRSLLRGEATDTDREMAYADIKAAWARYLANDNAGRGVVLIGHDQGAGILARLIASEIEGKPAQSLLVSAILLGSNIAIPDKGGAGGSFKSIVPCASNQDVGCFIAFSAFRADIPPPEKSLFGSVNEAGMQAACVNPADLDGSGGALKAYLPSHPTSPFVAAPRPWSATGGDIETTFVSVPGLLSARCENKGGYNYLAITTNGDPTDGRTDAIVGDVTVDGVVQPGWGLHLIDMGLTLGNLVDVVKEQSKAWRVKQTPATAAPAAAPKPQ
ncbi:MAG TPA: DUF3089 domain-containing protein [Hyphomonadaceae bacterium]|nr:DUF3089 domain-containing protein [Hyphomonadaceae bacterium]